MFVHNAIHYARAPLTRPRTRALERERARQPPIDPNRPGERKALASRRLPEHGKLSQWAEPAGGNS